MRVGIIGGGAAGIFAALILKKARPDIRVLVFEKTKQLLSKVKISGGGRCNVTHGCFDPKKLVLNYPRGSKELIGPFSRFQPSDMIDWFKDRGVELKMEDDGRMFPKTDSSQTIIDCFLEEARNLGVEILTEQKLLGIKQLSDNDSYKWNILFSDREAIDCNALIMATGSTKEPQDWLASLGQPMVSQVPSLFTFNVPSSPLLDLSGISVRDGIVSLPELKCSYRGPILITHWGFSGPAVLKLSAFAARDLLSCHYRTDILINWLPDIDVRTLLSKSKIEHTSKLIQNELPVNCIGITKSLWKRFCEIAQIGPEKRWAELSKIQLENLVNVCTQFRCKMDGKTTYKQEFVTAGGVAREGVSFSTMESKKLPKLYFAGELLDVDGITGGFNFQAAWTTAWIAANNIAQTLHRT